MTLSEIATYRVFTLTEVVAVVGGMEEDLDADDDLGGGQTQSWKRGEWSPATGRYICLYPYHQVILP